MTKKTIATNQVSVVCDVCGRTLLRGEQSDVFLAGGSRRTVCELCTPRAAHEGWIREGVGDDAIAVRQRRRVAGASLLGRLGRRRDAERSAPGVRRGPRAAADEPLEAPVLPYGGGDEPVYVAEVAPAVAPPPSLPAREEAPPSRQVRAIPTNADMKRARAVDVFNASAHPRTLAGVARSLGAPFVVVRPSDVEGNIVLIVAGWELTWYRFEVDLADEAAGPRVTGRGSELSELDPADMVPNAAADAAGAIALVG